MSVVDETGSATLAARRKSTEDGTHLSVSHGPNDAVYVRAATGAARLDVSVATWWRWVQQGRLPAPLKVSPGVSLWCWEEVVRAINAPGGNT